MTEFTVYSHVCTYGRVFAWMAWIETHDALHVLFAVGKSTFGAVPLITSSLSFQLRGSIYYRMFWLSDFFPLLLSSFGIVLDHQELAFLSKLNGVPILQLDN